MCLFTRANIKKEEKNQFSNVKRDAGKFNIVDVLWSEMSAAASYHMLPPNLSPLIAENSV